MATQFKNHTAQAIGTTAYYLVSQSSGSFGGGIQGLTSGKAVIMVGLMVSNILTTSISVDVVQPDAGGTGIGSMVNVIVNGDTMS